MRFAASLNSASEHLNKGNNNNSVPTKQSTKPSWHSPQDFRCKQEKTEHVAEDKSLNTHLEPKQLAVDQQPAVEPFQKYGWSSLQPWVGKTQQDIYSWQNHPAFRGEPGRFEQSQHSIKMKPVSI